MTLPPALAAAVKLCCAESEFFAHLAGHLILGNFTTEHVESWLPERGPRWTSWKPHVPLLATMLELIAYVKASR